MPAPRTRTQQSIAYELRRLAVQLEKSLRNGHVPIFAPGDIVQLKPSADRVFGGLFLRVTRVDPYCLRGYFLTPHRGGFAEAWYRVKPCEVDLIGPGAWPEARWGFKNWWA